MSRNIVPVTDYDQEKFTREVQTAVQQYRLVKYHTDGIKVIPLAASDDLSLAVGVVQDARNLAAGNIVTLVRVGVTYIYAEGTVAIVAGDALKADDALAGCVMKQGSATAQCEKIKAIGATAVAGPTAILCKVSL